MKDILSGSEWCGQLTECVRSVVESSGTMIKIAISDNVYKNKAVCKQCVCFFKKILYKDTY